MQKERIVEVIKDWIQVDNELKELQKKLKKETDMKCFILRSQKRDACTLKETYQELDDKNKKLQATIDQKSSLENLYQCCQHDIHESSTRPFFVAFSFFCRMFVIV